MALAIAGAIGSTAAEALASTDATPLVTMAALGDSLTRGWGSAGAPRDNPSASWATGADQAVASHFSRLLRAHPGLEAKNLAVSGSKMAATSTQADKAIAAEAGYVTLLSGTNDVCAATVDQMTSVSTFKSRLRTTLQKLSAIDGTHVLVASIPDWYGVWRDFRNDEDAAAVWRARDVCPTLLGTATSDGDRSIARQRLDEFNAALASVCAEFPHCTDDGGALADVDFTANDLGFDYFHPSVSGQARIASALWKVSPAAPPINTSRPALVGTPREGRTLVVEPGSWSNDPDTFSYHWLRCSATATACTTIRTASGTTYRVRRADVGSRLRVRVTARSMGGSAPAVTRATSVIAGASLHEILPNGNLEKKPWRTFLRRGRGTFAWTAARSRSPSHSLRIRSRGSKNNRLVTRATAIPATAGDVYRLRAWVRMRRLVGSAKLSVTFLSVSRHRLGVAASRGLKGTRSWRRLRVAKTAPPRTAFIRVKLHQRGRGTTWWDDLRLVRRQS
ncbi:MAG TPA: GDSL-type esterase/lipase family protein [Gaiellaceae bacterium]|nr:GDSL-type esterase/lipase family protein [Gaiellaceae bacterium]